MLLRMVSDTTGQCFIKATSKNKVDLHEILFSFAQVAPHRWTSVALVQTKQIMPSPHEDDGGLPEPVAGLPWLRA